MDDVKAPHRRASAHRRAVQRSLLVKMLKELKTKEVRAAADAAGALELLKSFPTRFDVIIIGLDIPAADLTFIRDLASGQCGTSLVVVGAPELELLSAVE